VKSWREVLPVLIVIIGAFISASSFNVFLIPHQLLSGGVSGISMILGYFFGWNIGLLYLLINLPLLVWGWAVIGRRFVMYSILSVVLTSWLMQVIPQIPLIAEPLLGSVFGGVLLGIGSGITLRAGGSSGGFDIVGSIVTRNRDFPLGSLLFVLNAAVILVLGTMKNWDLALSSMLSIYISGKIVDSIHVRHIKMTAFIITTLKQQMIEKLLQLPRGVTVVKTEGAYTHEQRDMLMTVTTRYEMAELRKIIRETDPKAFVNIVETVEVLGEFRRSKL
jgi:uncharacterized membrane-anchored protein YitT (DUF2179 family)